MLVVRSKHLLTLALPKRLSDLATLAVFPSEERFPPSPAKQMLTGFKQNDRLVSADKRWVSPVSHPSCEALVSSGAGPLNAANCMLILRLPGDRVVAGTQFATAAHVNITIWVPQPVLKTSSGLHCCVTHNLNWNSFSEPCSVPIHSERAYSAVGTCMPGITVWNVLLYRGRRYLQTTSRKNCSQSGDPASARS